MTAPIWPLCLMCFALGAACGGVVVAWIEARK